MLRVALAAALAVSPAVATGGATPSRQTAPSPPSNQSIAEYIDSYVGDAVRDRQIPGATVIVLRDGEPILAKGYGLEDYNSGRPMDVESSVLRLGSTAKTFVWLLVMQLVEEGRLDLDADINRYLDLRVPDAFGSPVTMRQLMTHSAGFEDRIPMVKRGTREAPIRTRLIENMPKRVYPPGSTVAYSNYGAALAAHVVERLRGVPFERVVEERIFAPLGMTSSTLSQPLPKHLRPRLVSYYGASSHDAARFEHVGLPAAGAASASSADMARFLAMLVNKGQLDGRRIVQPATLDRMTALQKPLSPDLRAGLGLGFIVGEHRGVRHVGHGGAVTAGFTELQILPEKGLSWYIGLNGRGLNGSAGPLRQDLLRAVIDRFYRSPASDTRASGASSAADVAGAYLPARRPHRGLPEFFSKLNLVQASANEDGSLSVDREGSVTHWLPAGRDRFVERASGMPLSATRADSGEVVRIASPLLNSVTEFERAPFSLRPAIYALMVAPPVLLLLGSVRFLAWILRRLKARRRRHSSAGRSSRAPLLRRLSDAALGLTLVAILAWAVFFVMTIANPGLISPAGAPLILNLLAMLTAVAAVVLAADAVGAWRDPSRSWLDRATATAAALAAVALASSLFVLDLATL